MEDLPRTVTVEELVNWIQYHCDKDVENDRKAGVTFLVGAGFSASAGIPTASEMIENLREHPLLQNVEKPLSVTSEYGYLMGKLPASERT